MVTNAIGPAVAANFFIYYLGLPHRIMICGINLPCYVIIVSLCLFLALVIIWPGGRISLLVTDCFQGTSLLSDLRHHRRLHHPEFLLVGRYRTGHVEPGSRTEFHESV